MKKHFRILALLAALVLLLTVLRLPAGADFGDFSGDSDWGGSDWDSGSDYDFDWSSSDYSGGGVGSVFGLVPAIVWIVIIVLIISNNQKKKSSGGAPVRTVQPAQNRNLRPISEYTKLDPAFNAAELKEKISNLYVQLQNGWTAKNLEALRPYFTDATFDQYDRQLNGYRQRHETNYVERITVLSTDILGFYQAAGLDHVVLRLQARIVDYTLNDNTGALVRGSRTAEKFMTYEFDLIRKSGVTTTAEGEMAHISCPNCGAPLDVNASAKCPYCDTVITRAAHDFAINNIRGISQRTVGK